MKHVVPGCAAVLFGLFSTGNAQAQSQNALDFDGFDDQVVVNNGSALVAGAGQLSLTCWVYPTNPAPSFPNFDGFAGFRNNVDVDFYLLHYSATSVEARFRNSSGTDFNIISQGLQLNAWQHYALTYDGTMMRLYRNGTVTDSVPANGTIASPTEPFYIGNLLFGVTNYLLTGRMDEISLWNHALSAGEVNCIYQSAIDTAASGLLLYYRCNQGVAGGSNAGIDSLVDAKQNMNGTLMNFALSGPASNWIAGVPNFTSDSVTLCPGDTLSYHGQSFSTPGNYTVYVNSGSVCDSVFELTLQVADTSVILNGVQLLAVQGGASYQWIRCDSGFAAIPGAVNQGYTPVSGGVYAVIISLGGCVDTSGCHAYSPTGIEPWSHVGPVILYPNPARTHLVLGGPEWHDWNLVISDLSGRIMYRRHIFDDQTRVDVSSWNSGVYCIRIEHESGTRIHRLVKM